MQDCWSTETFSIKNSQYLVNLNSCSFPLTPPEDFCHQEKLWSRAKSTPALKKATLHSAELVSLLIIVLK